MTEHADVARSVTMWILTLMLTILLLLAVVGWGVARGVVCVPVDGVVKGKPWHAGRLELCVVVTEQETGGPK